MKVYRVPAGKPLGDETHEMVDGVDLARQVGPWTDASGRCRRLRAPLAQAARPRQADTAAIGTRPNVRPRMCRLIR